MWDIDYLIQKPDLHDAFVYRYKRDSGVFRREVEKELVSVIKKKGYDLISCGFGDAPVSALGPETFMYHNPFALCMVKRDEKLNDGVLRAVWNVLSSGQARRFALFIPDGGPKQDATLHAMLRIPLAGNCLFVEERDVDNENLVPALSYLESTTQLASNLQLSSQKDFVESFADFLESDDTTIASLKREFDKRALLYTDESSGQFLSSPFESDENINGDARSPITVLKKLIRNPHCHRVVDLVAAVDRRYWTVPWTAINLTNELYRLSTGVLRDFRKRVLAGKRIGSDNLRNVTLWSSSLLAWETRLIQVSSDITHGYRASSDLSIIKVDQFSRDFLIRSTDIGDVDCLAGLWTDVTETLERVGRREDDLYAKVQPMQVGGGDGELRCRVRDWMGVARARERLVGALIEMARLFASDQSPRWIGRLRDLLENVPVGRS